MPLISLNANSFIVRIFDAGAGAAAANVAVAVLLHIIIHIVSSVWLGRVEMYRSNTCTYSVPTQRIRRKVRKEARKKVD